MVRPVMPKVWEELERHVTLAGAVRAPSGDGIGGIAVTATPGEKTRKKSAAGFIASGASTQTVSKGNGCFGFIDLPRGVYRVTARCNAWDADRFVSLEGRDDVEIPAEPPTAPPFVEIVLAVRTTDGERRAAQKVPATPPVRLEPASPGLRLIEFGRSS